MKIPFILFIIPDVHAAGVARLSWGTAEPLKVECEGEQYLYSVALDNMDLTYKNTFCASQHAKSADECSNPENITEKSQKCYKKLLHAPSQIKMSNELCSWGSTGAKMIVCEGQKFGYGNLDCTDSRGNVQLYHNVFCREELLNTGKDCTKDSAPVTKRCYAQLIDPDEPAVPEQSRRADSRISDGYLNRQYHRHAL